MLIGRRYRLPLLHPTTLLRERDKRCFGFSRLIICLFRSTHCLNLLINIQERLLMLSSADSGHLGEFGDLRNVADHYSWLWLPYFFRNILKIQENHTPFQHLFFGHLIIARIAHVGTDVLHVWKCDFLIIWNIGILTRWNFEALKLWDFKISNCRIHQLIDY